MRVLKGQILGSFCFYSGFWKLLKYMQVALSSFTARPQSAVFGVRRMRLFPSAYPHPYSHPTRLAGVRETAAMLPCSLGCILEVWKPPSHLLKLWAGSVVRLTLGLPFSVLWDLQPEDFFSFVLLSSLSCNWKKVKRKIFTLPASLRNCSIKWCHWPRAFTSPQFRHGCCRCAFFPGVGSFWVFFYALPGLPSSLRV